MRFIDRVLPGLLCLTALGQAGAPPAVAPPVCWPIPTWIHAEPSEAGLEFTALAEARDYALTGGGSGYITRHGRLVMAWGDGHRRYDLKSSTKSFGSVALGLAVTDGRLRLSDPACKYHPTLGIPPEANAAAGWLQKITIQQLASQCAGFEKPGGFTPLLFQPGTRWDYSDSGPNWLAECLTLIYRRDLAEWMFERVFTPIGLARSDLTWRANAYRPPTLEGIVRREFGAGIHASVDAMARLGYLMLRQGRWQDRQILSANFVRHATRTPPGHETLPVLHPELYGRASAHYGLLWWNNDDATLPEVPRDAFWSWGLYDSLILVIPSLDIVVARAGQSWARKADADHYDVLKPFFNPIVRSAQGTASPARSAAPHPPSTVIKTVRWSADLAERSAVFHHVGTCYRASVSYHPFLQGISGSRESHRARTHKVRDSAEDSGFTTARNLGAPGPPPISRSTGTSAPAKPPAYPHLG